MRILIIGSPQTVKIETMWRRLIHKLFYCPTFWKKAKYTCPICKKKYRCYWDGNDVGGYIDVCNDCKPFVEAWKDYDNTTEIYC